MLHGIWRHCLISLTVCFVVDGIFLLRFGKLDLTKGYLGLIHFLFDYLRLHQNQIVSRPRVGVRETGSVEMDCKQN